MTEGMKEREGENVNEEEEEKEREGENVNEEENKGENDEEREREEEKGMDCCCQSLSKQGHRHFFHNFI
jgi:hypothetical protein